MTDPARNCPEELLVFYVNATLDGDGLRQVEEHLRTCLDCRREVEELGALRRDIQQTAPAPPAGGLDRLLTAVGAEGETPEGPGRRRWRPEILGLVAACLAVAVAVTVWLPREPMPTVPRSGDGDTEAPLRSTVDPDTPLPRDGFVLSWEAQPPWEESSFSVVVTTEALDPVAEIHGLEETRFQVPPDALADLPAGARLLWRLEAVHPEAGRRTEVFRARLE
jgi:anti-sigma factor RsiW